MKAVDFFDKISRSEGIRRLINWDKNYSDYLTLLEKTIPYKIPKGYINWGKLKQILALHLYRYQQNQQRNVSYLEIYLANFGAATWFIQSAPIYLINNELLQAFYQTEILNKKSLLKEIKPVLPSFLLLFPENSVRSPRGGTIDYVTVHVSDPCCLEKTCGEKDGIEVFFSGWLERCNFAITWSSIDTTPNNWYSTIGVEDDGEIKTGDDNVNGGIVKKTELEFVTKMRNIVLQTLLCLCFKPELITDVEPSEIRESGKGFVVKGKSNQPHYLTPRWLGKNYQHQTTKGTRADKQYHVSGWWRKGFWRNQPYSSRENPQYRPTWIEPTWCQPGE